MPLDVPLGDLSMASDSIKKYTIQIGSKFLGLRKFPLLSHEKWTEEDPQCSLEWLDIWKKFLPSQKRLPPPQTILWWRLLHHNLMTANRLHHMVPNINPQCHHCNSAIETPGHLLLKCPISQEFWNFVFLFISSFLTEPFSSPPSLSDILSPFCISSLSTTPIITCISFAQWTIYRLHWAKVFDNKVMLIPALQSTFLSSLSTHLKVLLAQTRKKSKEEAESLCQEWNSSSLILIDPDKGLLFLKPP
jgi:zinc-binding in reverse transcriptase